MAAKESLKMNISDLKITYTGFRVTINLYIQNKSYGTTTQTTNFTKLNPF